MNISYITIHKQSDELAAVAQWAGHLLPPSWTAPLQGLNDNQQYQFLLGRILLYQRLSELGYSFTNIPKLYYNASGQPYFNEKLFFDISYTDDLVVVATSQKQPMGIHIEHIRPVSNTELQSYFSPREWFFILKKKLKPEKIVNGWIIREASKKLISQDDTAVLPFYKMKIKRSKVYFDEQLYYHSKLKLPKRYIGHIITRKSTRFTTTKNITPEIGSVLKIIRA